MLLLYLNSNPKKMKKTDIVYVKGTLLPKADEIRQANATRFEGGLKGHTPVIVQYMGSSIFELGFVEDSKIRVSEGGNRLEAEIRLVRAETGQIRSLDDCVKINGGDWQRYPD